MKKIETGRFIGSVISIAWVLLNLAISVKLFSEKRYYAGSGWLILLVISLIFAYFYHQTPKTSTKRDVSEERVLDPSSTMNVKEGTDNVLLASTKDSIQVERLREALIREGIHCVVLDQHSAVMMSFLPDVEMRIMVPAKDFAQSAKILNDIREPPGV